MESFLLFGIVLIIYIILISQNGYNFTSPAAIVCIMSLLTIFIMTLSFRRLEISISMVTIVLFLISLITFILSELLKPCKVSEICCISKCSYYSIYIIIFALVFVTISTALYYLEVRKIASMLGYNSSAAYGMLFYYRTATINGGSEIQSQSKWVGQLVIASFAISYLILIDVIKRIIFGIEKKRLEIILEILICLIFIVQCILSGGRTQFLYYIEASIFLFVFLHEKKTRHPIKQKSIRKLIVIVMIIFVLFYFLGSFTGKTSVLNFSNTLFAYIGAPIPAFDRLVNNEITFKHLYWGSNTFWGIIDILSRLGVNIEVPSMSAPFINIGGIDSNIYGSFGRYYADFGFLGIIILQILVGCIYHKWYGNLQKATQKLELKLALYMLVSQSLFDYCIEERFFSSVISFGTLLRVLYIIFFYYVFKVRVKRKDSN